MVISRREFVKWMSAGTLALHRGAARASATAAAHVVVIGAGYGGATAARYLKLWAPEIDVTLVERLAEFVSCPLSNMVLGGSVRLRDITISYEGLVKRGIRLVRDEAVSIDASRREVRLRRGAPVRYDRLIIAPGIDFIYDDIPALAGDSAQLRVPHAWKAGPQTVALRRQLEAIPDGGSYAIHIPLAPFRCAPGPYERACQVAHYFRVAKPRAKVIILDSNSDVVSKAALFKAAWNTLYKGIIDYRPNMELQDLNIESNTAILIGEEVRADVLNVIPPQGAGAVARQAGAVNINNRWCGVDWLTMESTAVPGVHVLGDAVLSAPAMPKSATMANQHAKVCVDAVIALLRGQPVNSAPMMMNTCYSFVDDKSAMHVASVHAYDSAQKTMIGVKGSGGLSDKPSELEGTYAWGWARNIWADSFA